MIDLDEILEKLKKNCYSNVQNEEEFNFLIDNYKDELLKKNPIETIAVNVDFYLQNDRVVEALNVLDKYQKMPYISMEVEDFMKDLKTEILKVSKKNNHERISKNDIQIKLNSKNLNDNIYILRYLSKQNIREYIDIIECFFNKSKNEQINRLLLIILCEQQINKEFIIYLGGIKKKYNPSNLILPFDDIKYKKMCNYINVNEKNPDSQTRKKEIFSLIVTNSFPDKEYVLYEEETLFQVISLYEKEMMGFFINLNDYDSKIKELYDLFKVYIQQ